MGTIPSNIISAFSWKHPIFPLGLYIFVCACVRVCVCVCERLEYHYASFTLRLTLVFSSTMTFNWRHANKGGQTLSSRVWLDSLLKKWGGFWAWLLQYALPSSCWHWSQLPSLHYYLTLPSDGLEKLWHLALQKRIHQWHLKAFLMEFPGVEDYLSLAFSFSKQIESDFPLCKGESLNRWRPGNIFHYMDSYLVDKNLIGRARRCMGYYMNFRRLQGILLLHDLRRWLIQIYVDINITHLGKSIHCLMSLRGWTTHSTAC